MGVRQPESDDMNTALDRHLRTHRRTPPGFTLLEILIAMFIFGIVVTTVFGSFHGVFGNVEQLEDSMNAFSMARDSFDRIAADLRAIYVTPAVAFSPPAEADDQDLFRLIGEADTGVDSDFSRLRFTSRAHLPIGDDRRDGIAEVIYYVTEETDGTRVLRRSDRLELSEAEAPSGNDPILCEQIRVFRIGFYDAEGEVLERWDSDSEEYDYATPRAIRVELEIGNDRYARGFDTAMWLPQYREKVDANR